MGSSLYTRKQAVVNTVEARVFAKTQDIQDAAICRQDLWLVFFGTLRELFLWTLCLQDILLHNTVDYYCTLLSDRLRPAVHRKRPGLLKKCVILQHDNAPPHMARQTIDKIEKIGWELLQHPPYSPDLAPSDFCFDHWKNLLDASSLIIMKLFNNMSYSFYVQPTKISMLQASADLWKDGNAVLNCRETMLKSNITVRIVRLPVLLLGFLVLDFIERPSYIRIVCTQYIDAAHFHRFWKLLVLRFCLCVCRSHGWGVQKLLNRSRCRLGTDSWRSKEPCIKWGPDPNRKGHFWAADCNVPTYMHCG